VEVYHFEIQKKEITIMTNTPQSYRLGIFHKFGAADAGFKLALVTLCNNGSPMERILPEFLGCILAEEMPSAGDLATLSTITLPSEGMGVGDHCWDQKWIRPKITPLSADLANLVGFTHYVVVEILRYENK
jgi:hypothetical protein